MQRITPKVFITDCHKGRDHQDLTVWGPTLQKMSREIIVRIRSQCFPILLICICAYLGTVSSTLHLIF